MLNLIEMPCVHVIDHFKCVITEYMYSVQIKGARPPMKITEKKIKIKKQSCRGFVCRGAAVMVLLSFFPQTTTTVELYFIHLVFGGARELDDIQSTIRQDQFLVNSAQCTASLMPHLLLMCECCSCTKMTPSVFLVHLVFFDETLGLLFFLLLFASHFHSIGFLADGYER